MNFIEHFNELNSRNVNDNVEKKNGLNYLSWAYVQQELTKLDENFQHRFIEFPSPDVPGGEFFVPYLKTEEGYMVCAEITLFGVTKREWLPVLNYKNQAIPKGSATTFDINKSMKRSFVKCAAQFGLGNYLYLGEDAPDESENLRQELMNEIQRFTDLLTVKGTEITPDEVKQKFQIGDISKLSQSDAIGHIKLIRANAQKLKENE